MSSRWDNVWRDPVVGRPCDDPVLKVLPRTDGHFVIFDRRRPIARGTVWVSTSRGSYGEQEAVAELHFRADEEGLAR